MRNLKNVRAMASAQRHVEEYDDEDDEEEEEEEEEDPDIIPPKRENRPVRQVRGFCTVYFVSRHLQSGAASCMPPCIPST